MKFAAPFQLKEHLNKQTDYIDEFNVKYDKNKTKINSLDETIEELATKSESEIKVVEDLSFSAMLDFIQEYPDKRININFISGIDIKALKTFNKISDNIYVRLSPQDTIYLSELHKEGIKFFFDSTLGVSNYRELKYFRSLGVSDIYIADDLWYNLSKVSEYCKENNISIRLILNHIPDTTGDRGKIPITNIFRPNDYNLLSKYVDVGEFDCGHPYNFMKQKVLYDTWFIKHDWFGDLREINEDLTFTIFNRSLDSHFSELRVKCGLACISRNISCNMCFDKLEIAEMLADRNIALKEE